MTVVLLTPRQVADRLGCAVSSLSKKRIYGGGAPFVRLGHSIRYPEDLLNEYIQKQPRYTSTAEATTATRGATRQANRSTEPHSSASPAHGSD